MSKLNEWLTIATNLGILVGLILVAYEIQQTNSALTQQSLAMQMETYQLGWDLMGDFHVRIAENPELTSLWYRGKTGEDLNEIEERQFQLLAETYFISHISLYAAWNANGQGRGDFAISQLKDELQSNRGFRDAYSKFRNKLHRRLDGKYNVNISEDQTQLNRGFWHQVDDVVGWVPENGKGMEN